MSYLYSAKSNAFYPEMWLDDYRDAGTLPSDLKKVKDEIFEEFSLGPVPKGMMRASNLNGLPCWVQIPPPSESDLSKNVLAYRDTLMRDATMQISTLEDAVEFGISTEEEENLLEAWKMYRITLSRISQEEGFPYEVNWPVKP